MTGAVLQADMDVRNLTADATVFTANAYLIQGERNSLVDVGAMPGMVDTLQEQVATLDSVFLTHRHDDHVDRLETVRAAFDPTVYAADSGPEAATVLADGDQVSIGGEAFEVVETPGHAPDHLAFVGDMAVFTGDIVVYSDEAFEDGSFGRTDIPGADRETLVKSIDRLLDRLPATVKSLYPGHGPAFAGDVRTVIERARGRAARGEPKYPE
ncbi:hydroxyacylglutathione hydrolase [Halodesulfurarchaeum formicicum]|uniref:Hydroxyacylglutathione hydrolase n=2 Tax=Halodesulfurarchaeum formicicum TaxID=1873524 RepID=A0A1D8S6S5_9EURY|nr:hydroxyacylglutathione hydrolase [Halodesulfurarchaeum formicicum]